eukprot:3594817-Rhodomonas_salina.2
MIVCYLCGTHSGYAATRLTRRWSSASRARYDPTLSPYALPTNLPMCTSMVLTPRVRSTNVARGSICLGASSVMSSTNVVYGAIGADRGRALHPRLGQRAFLFLFLFLSPRVSSSCAVSLHLSCPCVPSCRDPSRCGSSCSVSSIISFFCGSDGWAWEGRRTSTSEAAMASTATARCLPLPVHCQIKCIKTQSQYNLYQQCVFLCLISGCAEMGYAPTRCAVLK